MSCKILARLLGVLRNCLAQRCQVVELRLITQLAQEAYAQPLPVELSVPIEQMHFEERLRHRVHRGPAAYAGDCAARIYSFGFNLDDVNAGQGRPLRQRDVRRRKAKLAPQARTLADLAADAVRPPEQPLGAGEVAGSERRAHRGARNALAVER